MFGCGHYPNAIITKFSDLLQEKGPFMIKKQFVVTAKEVKNYLLFSFYLMHTCTCICGMSLAANFQK